MIFWWASSAQLDIVSSTKALETGLRLPTFSSAEISCLKRLATFVRDGGLYYYKKSKYIAVYPGKKSSEIIFFQFTLKYKVLFVSFVLQSAFKV